MKVKLLKSDLSISEIDIDFGKESKPISRSEIAVVNRVSKQNAKQGTKKTKGRSEVQGRSAKPFKQKGTGNARQGSRKGPHFVGGGIAHGPTPDFHTLTLNKKYKKNLTLRILSTISENISFVEEAKDVKGFRKALSSELNILYIYASDSKNSRLVRNIPGSKLINFDSLSPLHLLDVKKVYLDASLSKNFTKKEGGK